MATVDNAFVELCAGLEGLMALNVFESTAPALTQEEMEEWRWLHHPPNFSAQEGRRAECAQQPTISQCLSLNGTRRRRPTVRLPASRQPNDYDHLLDRRVYSPNGRPSGFWDWDRDEIEAENRFTPPLVEVPVEAPVNPIQERNRDIARRLLALPPILRLMVTDIAGYRAPLFRLQTALEEVESRVWWYMLLPQQRLIVRNVEIVLDMAREAFDDESWRNDVISAGFRVFAIRNIKPDSEAYPYLQRLIVHGEEQAEVEGMGQVSGVEFWLGAFLVLGEQGIEMALRQLCVHKIMAIKRAKNFRGLVMHIDMWLQMVKTPELRAIGVGERGGFWQHGLGYEDAYWYGQDVYGVRSLTDLANTDREALEAFIYGPDLHLGPPA